MTVSVEHTPAIVAPIYQQENDSNPIRSKGANLSPEPLIPHGRCDSGVSFFKEDAAPAHAIPRRPVPIQPLRLRSSASTLSSHHSRKAASVSSVSGLSSQATHPLALSVQHVPPPQVPPPDVPLLVIEFDQSHGDAAFTDKEEQLFVLRRENDGVEDSDRKGKGKAKENDEPLSSHGSTFEKRVKRETEERLKELEAVAAKYHQDTDDEDDNEDDDVGNNNRARIRRKTPLPQFLLAHAQQHPALEQMGLVDFAEFGQDERGGAGVEDLSWAFVAPPPILTGHGDDDQREDAETDLPDELQEILRAALGELKQRLEREHTAHIERVEQEARPHTEEGQPETEAQGSAASEADGLHAETLERERRGKQRERVPAIRSIRHFEQENTRKDGIMRRLRRRLLTRRESTRALADGYSGEGGYEDLLHVGTDSASMMSALAPLEMVDCVSCFETITAAEAVRVPCHSYCIDCFQQLVTTALDNEAQFPPKCCLNEIPAATIHKFVPSALDQRYASKAAEFALPVDQRLYCPAVNCGLFVPPSRVALADRIARCSSGHKMCILCRQAAHGTGSRARPCPNDRDKQMVDELAADAGWKRCVRCGILVEHRDACQHMTCRCGAQFCYVCGAVWHTCACSQNDLTALKQAASRRQAARLERERIEAIEAERNAQRLAAAAAAAVAAAAAAAEQEQRELDELKEALRLVAEAERVEAEKEGLRLAAQHGRLVALQQQREAAHHNRLVARYDALQAGLQAALSARDRRAQQQRRAERAASLETACAASAELEAAQAQDRAGACALANQQLATVRGAWLRDYRARVLEERRAEEAYRAGLVQSLLAQDTLSEGARALAAGALQSFMRRNDGHFDRYRQWRRGHLVAERARVDAELDAQEALRGEARLALAEAQVETAAAAAHRHAVERRWIRAVAVQAAIQLLEARRDELSFGLASSTADVDIEILVLLELHRNREINGAELENSIDQLLRRVDRDEKTPSSKRSSATASSGGGVRVV